MRVVSGICESSPFVDRIMFNLGRNSCDLKDGDPGVRQQAASRIGDVNLLNLNILPTEERTEVDNALKEVLPDLLGIASGDLSEEARRSAMWSIAIIGAHTLNQEEVQVPIAVLSGLLFSSSGSIRGEAAHDLGILAEKASSAAPFLSNAIRVNHNDLKFCETANSALARATQQSVA